MAAVSAREPSDTSSSSSRVQQERERPRARTAREPRRGNARLPTVQGAKRSGASPVQSRPQLERHRASPAPPGQGRANRGNRGKPPDHVIMEKLREQYGPHITADMTILGLRREVKRLGELLTKVLSLEQEADARASATEAALQRERSKLTRAEAKLREAEYALEQKDLELADKTDQLAELSQLRCLPSESANSLASEVVSLRRQLALVKEQNENLNDQVANTRRQLVLARLKVTS